MQLETHSDEALIDLAARRSRLHGSASVEFYARHYLRVSPAALRSGSALPEFARVTAVDASDLAKATPIRSGARVILHTEELRKADIDRSVGWVCPHCLMCDLQTRAELWSMRPYTRVCWTIDAVRACVRHEVMLMPSEGGLEGLFADDPTERQFMIRCQSLLAGCRRATSAELALSRFVSQRLDRIDPAHPFLKDLRLNLALGLSECVGSLIEKVADLSRSGDSRHETRLAGFQLLSGGEDGLLAFFGTEKHTRVFPRMDDPPTSYNFYVRVLAFVAAHRHGFQNLNLPIALGTFGNKPIVGDRKVARLFGVEAGDIRSLVNERVLTPSLRPYDDQEALFYRETLQKLNDEYVSANELFHNRPSLKTKMVDLLSSFGVKPIAKGASVGGIFYPRIEAYASLNQ